MKKLFVVVLIVSTLGIPNLSAMKNSELTADQDHDIYSNLLVYVQKNQHKTETLLKYLESLRRVHGIDKTAQLLQKCLAELKIIIWMMQDEDKWTLLQHAVKSGSVDMVKLILAAAGPDCAPALVCMQDQDGWSTVHLAAYNGHIEIAKLLLTAAGAVRAQMLLLLKDEFCLKVPFKLARCNGFFEMAEFLETYGSENK